MSIIKLNIQMIFRETKVVYSDDQLKLFEQNGEACNIQPTVPTTCLMVTVFCSSSQVMFRCKAL